MAYSRPSSYPYPRNLVDHKGELSPIGVKEHLEQLYKSMLENDSRGEYAKDKDTDIDLKELIVRPEWYGAKGDGVHDDTAAIQAAADALITTDSAHTTWGYSRPCGKHLIFSRGVYKVSSEITIGGTGLTGFSIEGAGAGSTIIVAGSAFVANTAVVRFTRAAGFLLSGISFDAYNNADNACWFDTPYIPSMTYRTGSGVITNCQFANALVEACRIADVEDYAGVSADVSDLTFINCNFRSSPIGVGLHANNALINKIIDGVFQSNATHVWMGQGGVTITNSQMVASTTQDIYLGGGARFGVDGLHTEQGTGHFLASGAGTHNMKVTLNRIMHSGTPADNKLIEWTTNASLMVTNSIFGDGVITLEQGADSFFWNVYIAGEMVAGRSGYNDDEAQFNYYHRASIWDRNGLFNTRRYVGNPVGITDITDGVDARDSNVFVYEVIADCTVALPINGKNGQFITYILKQANGGGWDVSWNSGFSMDLWSNRDNSNGTVKAISFYYNTDTWVQAGSLQRSSLLGLPNLLGPGSDKLIFWDETASELATNVGFDSDTTGWDVSNCTISSVAGGQSGNCLELTRVSDTYQFAFQEIAGLTIGESYTFTGYVKSGTSGNEQFVLRAYKSPDYGHFFQTTSTSSGTWTQHSLTFSALSTSYYFMLYKYSSTPGTMLFDTVSVLPSAGSLKWLACGNSVAITATTLDTIQDIRTTAGPTFATAKLTTLPPYANDTAAGAGGLTAGMLYVETGTDPLRLAVKS